MDLYQATIDEPIILPSASEMIWEKFEYFDKRAQEYPDNFNYEDTRDKLLAMWLEQFQNEYKRQVPIFKKEVKDEN